MKKILVLITSIVMLFLFMNNKSSDLIIPNEAIRFRVIANSNTIYDQNIKIQVRNVVQNKILDLTKDSKDISDTRKIINSNIGEINEIVKNKLKEIGYDKDFSIEYGLNYFPKKKYKGVVYNEGYYESLVITLGRGEGENFWCVLFPPLCLMEYDENNTNEVEYKFFIKEIIDKYFN